MCLFGQYFPAKDDTFAPVIQRPPRRIFGRQSPRGASRRGRVFFQPAPYPFLALPDFIAVQGEPRARFFQQPVFYAQFNNLALLRHSLAVENVKHRPAERRRHFVFHHLCLCLVSRRVLAFGDFGAAANVKPDGRIKLQRIPAGRHLRISVDHADFLAKLIYENQQGIRRLTLAVSFRSAWLISRACSPGSDAPISPSISARGVSAATLSMTTIPISPDAIRMSAISSAARRCPVATSSGRRRTPRYLPRSPRQRRVPRL